MPTRLTQEDREAVDLLLDKASHAGKTNLAGQTTFASSSKNVPSTHVKAVEKILHLLEACPTEDPPADLVAKTMRRIEGQAAPVVRATTLGAPIQNQPHA